MDVLVVGESSKSNAVVLLVEFVPGALTIGPQIFTLDKPSTALR